MWLSAEDFKAQRERDRTEHKEKYYAYLRSPQWETRRKRALKHANNRCVICHSSRYLNVHHASYANVFHEPLSDLVVLCRTCHKIFTDSGRLSD